ncbi:hypothetical protein BO99DRAFT_385569 [Aspergillus violaceofuscus CBS 115571]|uniref:Methyltransferase type 12 domain-containing protein n=1 Tax=Aspergillus violaceofuscus (strain CBS 115571) TaxID=1450538 RepID=A0A2V5IGW9_ASPV1|nr:hypothetical protein BO99DRAFT_385569 [Aspergillus violaceofuscus CBS 115571]
MTATEDPPAQPAWFETEVTSINPTAQRLLESYSNLKPDEVIPHVLAVRDEAFTVCQYPCIGQMRFLSFNLATLPFYPRVMDHLRANPAAGFLDVGCCVGQEIRYLANEGIHGRQLFGCDLEQIFIDLGYRLFRDADRLEATFVTGDLTAGEDEEFAQGRLAQTVNGKIEVVLTNSVLHLWDYETQVKVAARLVRLCKDQPGVMIAGRQMGTRLAGHYTMHGFMNDQVHYRHNVESIKGFWYDVGQVTGTGWRVEAELYWAEEWEKTRNVSFTDENVRMLWFCAVRE